MDTRSSTFIMFMIVSYCRRELSVLILIAVTRAAIRGGGCAWATSVFGSWHYTLHTDTTCTLIFKPTFGQGETWSHWWKKLSYMSWIIGNADKLLKCLCSTNQNTEKKSIKTFKSKTKAQKTLCLLNQKNIIRTLKILHIGPKNSRVIFKRVQQGKASDL